MTKDLPRGVTYKKARRKYIARIGVRGKSISLGSFDTAAEAEAAYAAAVTLYGPRDNIGLTEEQKDRYRCWLEQRPTIAKSFAAIGPFDPDNPWPVEDTRVKLPTNEVLVLDHYTRQVNVYGDHVTVAHFRGPCDFGKTLGSRCGAKVLTPYWLDGSDRPGAIWRRCEVHAKKSSLRSYRGFVAGWDAAHASVGRCRIADGPLPDDERQPMGQRARYYREKYNIVMDIVYESYGDVPSDWWRDFPPYVATPCADG
jgi:hypothetical protein